MLKPELRAGDGQKIEGFGIKQDNFKAFRDELRGSLSQSIDSFLETRKDYLGIGKRVIAGLLIPYENPSMIRIGVDGGWYDYLAEMLHARSPQEWRANRLKIVTYNYDRSLEYALATMLQAKYKLPPDQADAIRESLPIVHIHGTLSPFKASEESEGAIATTFTGSTTPAIVANAANAIKIIHETEDHTPELVAARDCIATSEHLVFLGFGYHRKNVERLQLGAFLTEKTIVHGTVQGFTSSQLGIDVLPLFVDMDAACEIPNYVESNGVIEFLKNHRHLFTRQR